MNRDVYTKKQVAAAKKIVRRRASDEDPTTVGECFPGDVIEVPFLGVCSFGFRLGRGDGFMRLVENNPPRHLWKVPDWVPVRCIERYRTNETG
jgi:hypothetical protein